MHPRRLPGPARLVQAAKRFRDEDGGNVMVYVSLTAAAILGMVGLALDGSRAMITHSEAQAAADAAALAAASQLDGQPGACARAKAQALAVTNNQRFAAGGPSAVALASGSSRCLSTLPASDSTAIPSSMATTSDADARFVEVVTQPLTHENTLLKAVSDDAGATLQRRAVAGFRRSLCAASPVMMMCQSVRWTAGVAFDAWRSYGGDKGFVCPDCQSANAVEAVLASTTPQFCVTDHADPAPGNKTTKAADGINTRFGQGSTSSRPSDTNITSYPRDKVTGSPGWDCAAYWAANHATDGFARPGACTSSTTGLSRYDVYRSERAAGRIPAAGRPPAGTPTMASERRLIYLAIMDCTSGATRPVSYLKAFMIEPAVGTSSKTQFVEAIGLVTSGSDPNVLHEDVQLYR
jgi:hypothetical protein